MHLVKSTNYLSACFQASHLVILRNQKTKSISGIYIDVDTTYFVLIIKQIRTIFHYGAIRKSNVMWSNFENANVSLRSGIFCQSGQKRT